MGGDHKCSVCQATFTRPQHVARHMRSHTGDRPYKCPQCGDQFARSDLLSRHVNKCHPEHKEGDTGGGNAQQASSTSRRKGISASRATTSKQACDQCVQNSLPCDGCNPCAKCVQRKCRCTFVKFHRQTAPSGPGHTHPHTTAGYGVKSDPLGLGIGGMSAAALGLPIGMGYDALGGSSGTSSISSSLGSTSSMPADYSFNPVFDLDMGGPAGGGTNSKYGGVTQNEDFAAKYRQQAELLRQMGTGNPGTSSSYTGGSQVASGGAGNWWPTAASTSFPGTSSAALAGTPSSLPSARYALLEELPQRGRFEATVGNPSQQRRASIPAEWPERHAQIMAERRLHGQQGSPQFPQQGSPFQDAPHPSQQGSPYQAGGPFSHSPPYGQPAGSSSYGQAGGSPPYGQSAGFPAHYGQPGSHQGSPYVGEGGFGSQHSSPYQAQGEWGAPMEGMRQPMAASMSGQAPMPGQAPMAGQSMQGQSMAPGQSMEGIRGQPPMDGLRQQQLVDQHLADQRQQQLVENRLAEVRKIPGVNGWDAQMGMHRGGEAGSHSSSPTPSSSLSRHSSISSRSSVSVSRHPSTSDRHAAAAGRHPSFGSNDGRPYSSSGASDQQEGGFSSAFGLMSLDDPAVLAGLATDGAEFFSAEATSGAPGTVPQQNGRPRGVGFMSVDDLTPMPRTGGLGLGSPSKLGLASPSRAEETQELRDFWKAYIQTPGGSGGRSAGINGGFDLNNVATSPTGYRRTRVSSLPSVKTPTAEGAGGVGNDAKQSTLHGAAEDLRSYEAAVLARRAPVHLNLVPRIRRGTNSSKDKASPKDMHGAASSANQSPYSSASPSPHTGHVSFAPMHQGTQPFPTQGGSGGGENMLRPSFKRLASSTLEPELVKKRNTIEEGDDPFLREVSSSNASPYSSVENSPAPGSAPFAAAQAGLMQA
ncbi:hypothetical protein EV715DRAFT_252875 [Schizophyllum commune]